MSRSPYHRRVSSDRGYTVTELLMALVILALIAAISVPFTANTFAMFRLGGDARMILNAVSVAKMRAAANFTQARLYVDLGARTHHIEILQRTPVLAWNVDGATASL